MSVGSCLRALVCVVSSQLFEFQLVFHDQRPEKRVTSPSALDPSALQTGIDFATTIQFHHGTSGDAPGGGTQPVANPGPKHTAVHIPRVSVGVT